MKKQKNTGENSARWREHYQMADINGRLVINFRDISHIMRSLYEGKGSQRRILIILLDSGRITQRELTKKLGIQPGSASEVLAKLESAGLIQRMVSEKDRRTTDIVLTQTGRQEAVAAAHRRNLRHEQMFSCLEEREKQQLLTLLEKICGDWEKRYRETEDKGPVQKE